MNATILEDASGMRDPGKDGALDDRGELRVLPAAFWRGYTQTEIALFCHRHAFYVVPTTELIAWLRAGIDGLVPSRAWSLAIEIGAGCGVLGKALDIMATDSKMQERADIQALYKATGQPVITYGDSVRALDANSAVTSLRPDVVIAAWVTHRYDPAEPERGGNMFGVDFRALLQRTDLIFVGNRGTHAMHPIMDWPHTEYEFPWLVSRAVNGKPDFIGTWKRGCV